MSLFACLLLNATASLLCAHALPTSKYPALSMVCGIGNLAFALHWAQGILRRQRGAM